MSNDQYFLAPAPRSATAPSIVPSRVGAAPPAPIARHAAPKSSSRGWLVAVALGAAVVVAVVTGFVVLAHKDKHTAGNALLRPIQQADRVQLDSDLRLAATAEESWLAEHGSYTANLNAAGFRSSSGTRVSVVSAGGSAYCLRASNATRQATEYYSRAGGFSAKPCR